MERLEMKDSFIFYKSFYDSIHRVKNKELKSDLFEAICELALYNNDIDLTDDVGLMIMDLIKPQIMANNKRYEDGKKGGRPKKITSGSDEEETSGYENKKPNVNVNVNVNDNIKENTKRKVTFKKPTIEEIKNYCLERNNGIDANKFYDFYESKDWYIGKNKMKDWKACIRTWENKSVKKAETPEWFNKNFNEKKERILTKEDYEIIRKVKEADRREKTNKNNNV